MPVKKDRGEMNKTELLRECADYLERIAVATEKIASTVREDEKPRLRVDQNSEWLT